MTLILKAPTPQFPPAPEGNYPATCVDFLDLGMVEKKAFDDMNKTVLKHMCCIVWELDEINPDTSERYMAQQEYVVSLHEKAKLYKTLVAWRGRAFNAEELAGFDSENVVGKPCLVQITHKIGRNGGVWSNVSQVAALPKGVPAIEPTGKYVRRPSAAAAGNGHQEATSAPF